MKLQKKTSLIPIVAVVAALAFVGATSSSSWASELLGAPPGPPTGVSASDGTSFVAVHVTWTAVANADSYEVWRNAPAEVSVPIGSTFETSFDDFNAVEGVTYTYKVRAGNEMGFGQFSDTDLGSIDEGPAAPAQISASDGTVDGAVLVTWTEVEDADLYQVWRRRLPNGAALPIALRTNLFFSDQTALPGVTYRYWVRAHDSDGWGPFSAPNDGSRGGPAVPVTPSNVIATDGTHPDFVLVTWAHPGLPIEFEIWRRALPGGTPVRVATRSGVFRWYLDQDAEAGVIYRYWVRARNSSGFSAFSVPDTGFTDGPTPPEAPQGLVASDGTHDDFVLLSWLPATDADEHQIWRRRLPGGLPFPIGTRPGDANWFTDSTADPGVIYRYWVRARNENGWGPFSAPNDGSR